ncbi:MAG: 4-hydroxy-tetrahydrodipicolinate synthase [Opitutaceae bacterium]
MSGPTFTGTLTALITPLRDQAVAFDDLEKVVHQQIAAGISALVPCGTTGESPTLDHDEHIDVVRAVVAATQRRVPVIAGTGSNSTREAVRLTRLAHECGVDGVLQVAPYYNKPSQEGLFQHFSAVARETDKPIILYSIPSRCGIEIAVSTVERLREAHPHINHIKEAGGSCDRVDQLRQRLGDAMTILSGDDSLTLPFLSIGAKGVISVASNVFPEEIQMKVQSFLKGDLKTALALQHRFQPLFKALFCEPNPVPVKAAMHHLGMISSAEVRPPLCAMSAENRALLLGALEALS